MKFIWCFFFIIIFIRLQLQFGLISQHTAIYFLLYQGMLCLSYIVNAKHIYDYMTWICDNINAKFYYICVEIYYKYIFFFSRTEQIYSYRIKYAHAHTLIRTPCHPEILLRWQKKKNWFLFWVLHFFSCSFPRIPFVCTVHTFCIKYTSAQTHTHTHNYFLGIFFSSSSFIQPKKCNVYYTWHCLYMCIIGR